MVPVAEVGDLWGRIFEIASTEFPELKMTAPTQKGGQSKWIIFKAGLPSKITIDWKITKPSVELSFWPGAMHRPSDSMDLSGLKGGRRGLNGRTAVIGLPAPRPPSEDWTKMPDDQVREALGMAQSLLQFYRENSNHFVSASIDAHS